MVRPLTKRETSQLVGNFYILIRDYIPYEGDRYFVAGEFKVTKPGTFQKCLLSALKQFRDEISAHLENTEEFDPNYDIIIIPESSWFTLEKLDLEEDINQLLFDEFSEFEDEDDEKADDIDDEENDESIS
jgi:hypothetical protein